MNKGGVYASTIKIAIDGKPYGIMQTYVVHDQENWGVGCDVEF